MEIRNPRASSRSSKGRVAGHYRVSRLASALLACAAILAGCASPGEPTERKPPTPQPVTDLSAEQSGNDVVLTFAMPTESVDGRLLDRPPSIEIFRDFEPSSGASGHPTPPANPTLLLTIPAGMVDRYAQNGRVRIADALQATDFSAHPDAIAVYTVRTRVSPKRDSADSNVVGVHVLPAAEPIDDLKAEVAPSAVVLTWTAPGKTIAGTTPSIGPFAIYRAEIAAPRPPNGGAATGKPATAGEPAVAAAPALVKIGQADAPPFSDTQAIFGTAYEYSVRSIVQYPSQAIESADSNVVAITPKDVFPPAAPQGLVVVFVPAQGTTPAHLELSWAISPETDIAGYDAYRSEQDGVQGTRQNTELLIAPAFRDMNVQPGRRYFYSVTAVDRSGNEGPASAIVSGGVPAERQPTP